MLLQLEIQYMNTLCKSNKSNLLLQEQINYTTYNFQKKIQRRNTEINNLKIKLKLA